MRNLQTSEREKEKENVPHRPYQAVASINHHMFIGLQHIIPIEFKACLHTGHTLFTEPVMSWTLKTIFSLIFPFYTFFSKTVFFHSNLSISINVLEILHIFFSQSNLELLLNYPM